MRHCLNWGITAVPATIFPGEKAVKAPSFHGDNYTFTDAYLVNIGDQIDTPDWHAGAARAAEYLFCTTVTPAKAIIDAARHADAGQAPSTDSTVQLRSLDICRLDPNDSDQVSDCIEQACRDVVAIWESGSIPAEDVPPPAASSDSGALIDLCTMPLEVDATPVESASPQWLDEFGLTPTQLHWTANQIVEGIWGCPEEEYLLRVSEKLCAGGNDRNIPRHELVEAAERLMDRILGDSAELVDTDFEQESLCDQIRDSFAAHASRLGAELVARIASHVDDPAAGVKFARSSADAAMQRLKETRKELKQAVGGSPSNLEEDVPPDSPVPERSWLGLFRRRSARQKLSLMDELLTNATQRIDKAKLAAIQQYLSLIETQVSAVSDQLNHLSRDLNCLSAELQSDSRDAADSHQGQGLGPAAMEYTRRIHDALNRDRESIALRVSGELFRTVLNGEKKLRRFLGMHSQLQSTLQSPLRTVARQVVLAYVRQTTQQMIESSAQKSRADRESACVRLISEFVQERCLEPDERLIVVAPDSVAPQHVEAAFAPCTSTTFVSARTNGITICREGASRPLEHVADEIIQQQDLYRQLAEKLHTREDVNWSPLALPGASRSRPHADVAPAPQS